MAYLLGNKYCIESLRTDVQDVEEALTDVFSRSGPVHVPSWKYPDKAACDVNVAEILEIHEYSEDEEERQVAHIILLELVIDRLVLLLQATSRYMDQMLALGGSGTSQMNTEHISIGLIVRKYWAKMVSTYACLQQLQSEGRSKSRKINDLENTVKKMSQELEDIQELGPGKRDSSVSTLWSPEITQALTKSGLIQDSSPPKATPDISRDEYVKATQTIETAFVPCESCARVQENLREVGDCITNICQTQELPSMLARHLSQIQGIDWLTANDIARWTAEQNKDLVQINTHLSYLHSTIDPLKKDVSDLLKLNKQLEETSEKCKKMAAVEKQTSSTQLKQFETKLKSLKEQSDQSLKAAKSENDDLSKSKSLLTDQMSSLKSELGKQKELMEQLESVKKDLEEELQESLTNNEDVKRLEGEISQYQSKLKDVQRELTREKAKAKSVNKHSESMMGKQDSLVRRLDELDQENTEIRENVAELEEEKDSLQAALERVEDEKRGIKANLAEEKARVTSLNKEKESLRKSIAELEENLSQLEGQMEEARQRERMLIEYPDLNGPINKEISGTGDLVTDMENQVQANSVRIRILEEQNTSLRNSITKILQSQSKPRDNPTEAFGSPVSLWRPTNQDSDMATSPQHTNSSPEMPSPPDSQFSSKPPRPPSSRKENRQETFVVQRGPKMEKNRARSRSGSRESSKNSAAGSSSINAYLSLKKSGLLKTGSKAHEGTSKDTPTTPSTATTQYNPKPVFMCGRCDKMYTTAKDLDIHKSYCTR